MALSTIMKPTNPTRKKLQVAAYHKGTRQKSQTLTLQKSLPLSNGSHRGSGILLLLGSARPLAYLILIEQVDALNPHFSDI